MIKIYDTEDLTSEMGMLMDNERIKVTKPAPAGLECPWCDGLMDEIWESIELDLEEGDGEEFCSLHCLESSREVERQMESD